MRAQNDQRFWRVPFDFGEITRVRGDIQIKEEICKGCAFCAEFCPLDVLTMSKRFNAKGYHPPDVSAPAECNGCHLCELLCPEFAIRVEETEWRRADES